MDRPLARRVGAVSEDAGGGRVTWALKELCDSPPANPSVLLVLRFLCLGCFLCFTHTTLVVKLLVFFHTVCFSPLLRSLGFFLVRTFSGVGHTLQGLRVGRGSDDTAALRGWSSLVMWYLFIDSL